MGKKQQKQQQNHTTMEYNNYVEYHSDSDDFGVFDIADFAKQIQSQQINQTSVSTQYQHKKKEKERKRLEKEERKREKKERKRKLKEKEKEIEEIERRMYSQNAPNTDYAKL